MCGSYDVMCAFSHSLTKATIPPPSRRNLPQERRLQRNSASLRKLTHSLTKGHSLTQAPTLPQTHESSLTKVREVTKPHSRSPIHSKWKLSSKFRHTARSFFDLMCLVGCLFCSLVLCTPDSQLGRCGMPTHSKRTPRWAGKAAVSPFKKRVRKEPADDGTLVAHLDNETVACLSTSSSQAGDESTVPFQTSAVQRTRENSTSSDINFQEPVYATDLNSGLEEKPLFSAATSTVLTQSQLTGRSTVVVQVHQTDC